MADLNPSFVPPSGNPGESSRGSIADLLRGLAEDLATLVKQHIDVAKEETVAAARSARAGMVLLGVGVAILVVGMPFLLLSGMFALTRYVDNWLAALIIGGAAMVVGGIFLLAAKRKLSADMLIPKQTIRAVQRDKDLIRSTAS